MITSKNDKLYYSKEKVIKGIFKEIELQKVNIDKVDSSKVHIRGQLPKRISSNTNLDFRNSSEIE